MRIGLVVPGFSADASDWCIPALRHLARHLARTDDVRVVAIRYPYRAGRYEIDGARVLALGGGTRRGPATLDVWRTTLTTLAAEHRRQPFDVLHAFWATESGLLSAIAGRRLGIKTVVSLAGGELVALPDIAYGDQRRAWERLKVRASLRLARRVTAGSRYLLQMAMRHADSARLSLAPLGLPLDLFSAPTDDGRLHDSVVNVGALTAVKDQVSLLRAFAIARARRPALQLTIVGDGPLRAMLRSTAHDLGIGEAVCFCGNIDHASLPAVYRAHGGLALSSRHEAQGMVAIEAAACGAAVVGTRVGVIPDLAARPAPIGDHAALAEALLTVAADALPGADWAYEQAQRYYGLDTCTDQFRELYQEE